MLKILEILEIYSSIIIINNYRGKKMKIIIFSLMVLSFLACDFSEYGYVKKSEVLKILKNKMTECEKQADSSIMYSDGWYYSAGCNNGVGQVRAKVEELQVAD